MYVIVPSLKLNTLDIYTIYASVIFSCIHIVQVNVDRHFTQYIIVHLSDIFFMLTLLILNTYAITTLHVIFPRSIILYVTIRLFECYLLYTIIHGYDMLYREYINITTLQYDSGFNIRSNTGQIQKSEWYVPHTKDTKIRDTCLICLESLCDSEYVYLCLYPLQDNESKNVISVELHVNNTLLQCKTCRCTLHLKCHTLCHGICPICR